MKKISLDVTLPIYNEENELEKNTLKLHKYLLDQYGKGNFKITIADNASTDGSLSIARKLSQNYKEIGYIYLPLKGRGRAIKKSWRDSSAEILIYMDIDLSTRLNSLPKIVTAIKDKKYDIAVGSRLLPTSKIYNRPFQREILSRGLNILIKMIFQTKFSDAQCGFKAITYKRKDILDKVVDNEWFFDSELLIIAEKSNLKIYEEPVYWVDNPGSTVRVLGTVVGDMFGLLRLFFTRPWITAKIIV